MKPPLLFGREVRRIHCVGVTGMGLAPLAIYLRGSGFDVTGEDDAPVPEVVAALTAAGVGISPRPGACDLVVCSSAIAPDHPARVAAQGRNLPVVRRGELLAEVARGRKLVAVCGSHGKTTTTAMLVTALRAAEFPAGHVLGGLFAPGGPPPAAVGTNDWLVAEVDESDGTIDRFSPEITLVVNLDWDHPDHYHRLADLERTFAELVARTTGTVLINSACPLSVRLAPGARTVGRDGEFAWSIDREETGSLRLRLGGAFGLDAAVVRAGGEFNAANAAAALAAARLMGATLSPAVLADYPGVRRRQAVLHAAGGVTVIEDYAHHPAEIRALLAGLRPRVGTGGRLVAVFQPHRYSRTAQFKAEFASALAAADRLHLLEVYPAGEAPVPGGAGADLHAAFGGAADGLPVTYHAGDDAGLFRALAAEVRPGDVVAFIGAGDIDRKAHKWVESLRMAGTARWDALAATLKQELGAAAGLRREEPLGPRTTMRVGGAARLYAEPATEADLQVLLRHARQAGAEVYLLGRGSNLIVPDEGVEGIVIALSHAHWAGFEPLPEGRIRVGAGLRLKNLCGLAAKAGLVGFEFLEGIPGNVGGALRMNAGAMGGWMFDVVEQVRLMTPDGEIRTLAKADMHVGYRHCAELQQAVALGAVLRPAAQSESAAISRQIDVYRRKRHESQPREPSAGCIFKNPPGESAGRLIDRSGLKGERVGDAEVSRVHANFIVNRGRATAADVLELVRRVRDRVRQTTGVELEPEVLLYGRAWRDVL
ncbi:MAG: UDP-N-acetylmuramate dehydrogenase [Opitutaceae bacterium]|nr:UDP-N-acetylmuramate dehydrogenase [Opitutaceae bacterium]